MSIVSHQGGQKKPQSFRNIRNPYEAEIGYSRQKAKLQTNPVTREGMRDIAHNTARGLDNAIGNASTDVVDEYIPHTTPDRGGVRIPTIAEYQREQQNIQLRFHQEQQRAAELASRRRKEEDDKHIDDIKHILRSEIDRFEKIQRQMNENIERAKKLLLLDQKEFKKGLYHVTIAEVLLMALRNAIVDITNSNNWLEALMSKKKKRGSLYAVRSKKMGTQYSLSQELSISRSTG